MSAVGKIDVFTRVGGLPECLLRQGQNGHGRSVAPVTSSALGSWVAEPPAQAKIEYRQQQCDRRRGVVAHAGICRRAGNRHRRAERHAARSAVLTARTVGALGTIMLIAAFLVPRVGFAAGAAMQRANSERRRLALLPSETLRRHDVERQVQDMKRPPLICRRGVAGPPRPQLMHLDVIVLVETRERIGPAAT